jgi:hypothetical protein
LGERGPKQGEASGDLLAQLEQLDQLGQAEVGFGGDIDRARLREASFTEFGLAVPAQFAQLSRDNAFYWLKLPLRLVPPRNMAFCKLQCMVEFNPGQNDGTPRPRARAILPDRKFRDLASLNNSIELKLGQNLDFEASAKLPELPAAVAAAATAAGLPATLNANTGLNIKDAVSVGAVVGPYTYTLRKAELDHRGEGTEKVWWKIDGADFFQDGEPVFVVVLQIPKGIQTVKVAAAMQGYLKFDWASGLTAAVTYIGDQLRRFLQSGAPVPAKQEWEFTV